MKKYLALALAIVFCTCGCGKKDGTNVVKDLTDKVNNTKSYTLKGNMEIYADEETFTYAIEANHLKDDYYKVVMVNQTNNHEQVLLRNADAVYVITPSLNKSFKFQSEWPNNSSQSYLLKSIMNDINNDNEKVVETTDDGYVIKSKVNFPNNPELKYQKITVDKEGNLKKNEVYDDKDKLKMKVNFTSIDYSSGLKESDFKLEQYIKEETKTDNKDNTKKEDCKEDEKTCKEEKSACEGDTCSKKTSSLKDIMYPLYIPSNTYLSASDKVNTDDGDRIILTFGGEKNFVLVEEQAVIAPEFEVIPVYGDPLIVNDTLGALGANSLSWTKDNVSYYLASNDLSSEELLTIGESIRTENITVSREK